MIILAMTTVYHRHHHYHIHKTVPTVNHKVLRLSLTFHFLFRFFFFFFFKQYTCFPSRAWAAVTPPRPSKEQLGGDVKKKIKDVFSLQVSVKPELLPQSGDFVALC